MKRLLCLLLLLFGLAGCKSQTVWETVTDSVVEAGKFTPAEMQLEDGELLMQDGEHTLYACGANWAYAEIYPCGDLNAVCRSITGRELEAVTCMGGEDCQYLGWAAADEEGISVYRCCLRSDGRYYYALTACLPENQAGELSTVMAELESSLFFS